MVIILLVAIAVPITLGLIKQNQDNRQQAAAPGYRAGTAGEIATCKANCPASGWSRTGCLTACEGLEVPDSSGGGDSCTPCTSGQTTSICTRSNGTQYSQSCPTAGNTSQTCGAGGYTNNSHTKRSQGVTGYTHVTCGNGSVCDGGPNAHGAYWCVTEDSSKVGIGDACERDADCSNNRCGANGKCVECQSDGQCKGYEHCTYFNETPNFTCKLDPGACDSNADCSNGQICSASNLCVAAPTATRTPTRTPTPSTTVATSTPTTVAATATRTPTRTLTPSGATATRTPTPSGQQGNMNLNFAVLLPGIGNGGVASGSAATGNNMTPKRPTRQGQIQIFNTNNEQVKSSAVTFTYQTASASAQTGRYTGTVNVTGVSAGTYYIKISMDNTLFTQIPGVVNLTTGNNTLSALTLVPGDLNQDNNLNMSDHSIFVGCYGEKECPAENKTRSDFNDDGVIDGKDYNILIRSFAIRSGD